MPRNDILMPSLISAGAAPVTLLVGTAWALGGMHAREMSGNFTHRIAINYVRIMGLRNPCVKLPLKLYCKCMHKLIFFAKMCGWTRFCETRSLRFHLVYSGELVELMSLYPNKCKNMKQNTQTQNSLYVVS